MRQLLLALMTGAFLMAPLVAQETDDEEQADQAPEEEELEDGEIIDEVGLDAQGFEEDDDDDFVPTEDIPTDQSIPFPTDI